MTLVSKFRKKYRGKGKILSISQGDENLIAVLLKESPSYYNVRVFTLIRDSFRLTSVVEGINSLKRARKIFKQTVREF